MASIQFEASTWEHAMLSVKTLFQIGSLLPEQEEAIRAFMETGNLFVNLPTGFVKSLIFQCIPFVADILYSRPGCFSLRRRLQNPCFISDKTRVLKSAAQATI